MCVQLHPTLCDPIDCSPPGSSVHGIFQARILELRGKRILEWVAISYSRDLPDPDIEPTPAASPAWAGRFLFTTVPSGKPFGIPWLIDESPKSLPSNSHDILPMYVSVSKMPLSYKNTSQI